MQFCAHDNQDADTGVARVKHNNNFLSFWGSICIAVHINHEELFMKSTLRHMTKAGKLKNYDMLIAEACCAHVLVHSGFW